MSSGPSRCMIVVEGPDGCGKTTISEALCSELRTRTQKGWVLVPDPSAGPVGQLIRSYLRGGGKRPLDSLGYLFMADRMDQLDAWGQAHVVADRFLLSTWVYQHGFMPGAVLEACLNDPRLRAPDIVVFLDTPLELCIERCARRKGKAPEIFEQRDRMARQHERYHAAWFREGLPACIVGTRQIAVGITSASKPGEITGEILRQMASFGYLPEN